MSYIKENGRFVEVTVLTAFHNLSDPELVIVADTEGTLKIVNINIIYDKLPAAEDQEEVELLHKTVERLTAELDRMKAQAKQAAPDLVKFLENMLKQK